jgi:hypothetical protein
MTTSVPATSLDGRGIDVEHDGGASIIINRSDRLVVLLFRARLCPAHMRAVAQHGFRFNAVHGGFSRVLSLESLADARAVAHAIGTSAEQLTTRRLKHDQPLPF